MASEVDVYCCFQVMFVEVSSIMLQKGLPMAKAAKKYDKWRRAQVTQAGILIANCRLSFEA